MGDDHEDDTILIEAPGQGGPVQVRARAVDGPNPCPFCDGAYTIFETPDGNGLIGHPDPVCQAFGSLDTATYLQRATEASAGVNSGGRGAA